MRATYYISFDEITWTQFYPSNEPVLKLEQEAGEIFKRWKVDRFRISKTKNSSLYTTLQGMFFGPTSFGSEINYRININGTPKYYFKDTIRAGNLNIQNKVYECAPTPDDDYEPILRSYTKKWDNTSLLFGLAGNLYLPGLSTGVYFINVDFTTFSDIGTITYSNSGSAPYYKCARRAIAVPEDGSIVTILITGLSYTGDAPKMKLVDGSFTTCSNEVTINANGHYELTMSGVKTTVYIQLSQNNLTGSSKGGTFTYQIYLPELTLAGATLYNLLDRIINFVSYFDLSYDIVSTILWNDALGSDPPASIDTYITANPTNDYVLEGTAVFNNLYVTRTDTFTTEKEDNVEISLKDIMDILKAKRLWWFIDEDGKFRIEHDKYFRSYDAQADLRTSTYEKYKPEIDKKLYSYEGENYNQINFIEDNAVNEDWTPVRIEYDALLTGNDIQDIRSSFTTDVKNLLDNPDLSGSGLTLLRCNANNNILWDESLVTSGVCYPNQKLSPAWMSAYYMDYFAEAEDGEIVTGAHSFIHVKETVKQSGVKFKMTADLDWKKPFTMTIGAGWLSSAEYFPETGWYSIDVLYNPYEISIAGPPAGEGEVTADSTLITADSTLITADSD